MPKIENNAFIISSQGSALRYLGECYRHRELLFFFTWRDTLVRYRQAFFGIAWALIRPLLNMLVFVIIFGKVAHLSSGDVNYSLFVLAGMLPWQLFSNSTIETCSSLVNNVNLVSRAPFPRILIPTSQILVQTIDFLITALLLSVLTVIFGDISANALLFIPALLLTLGLCLGVSLWLSALTVLYRDFRIIVPFFAQLGMFLSPVGYGTFIIPEKWQWFYSLNPMVGIIDLYRYLFFGQTYPFFMASLINSVVISSIILISGFLFFRRMESVFSDRI